MQSVGYWLLSKFWALSMTTPLALHSKATPNWGTPGDVIERARATMGGIDLDPCTSHEFNQSVGAARIFTRDDDGLRQSWAPPMIRMLSPLAPQETAYAIGKRVFINPPGGLVREFWDKLISEMEAGHVDQAVWVGFSVEQLCLLASEPVHPLDFSTCITRKRISFIREDGYKGSPSHGNYITGIGVDHAAFEKNFSSLGRVIRGPLVV